MCRGIAREKNKSLYESAPSRLFPAQLLLADYLETVESVEAAGPLRALPYSLARGSESSLAKDSSDLGSRLAHPQGGVDSFFSFPETISWEQHSSISERDSSETQYTITACHSDRSSYSMCALEHSELTSTFSEDQNRGESWGAHCFSGEAEVPPFEFCPDKSSFFCPSSSSAEPQVDDIVHYSRLYRPPPSQRPAHSSSSPTARQFTAPKTVDDWVHAQTYFVLP